LSFSASSEAVTFQNFLKAEFFQHVFDAGKTRQQSTFKTFSKPSFSAPHQAKAKGQDGCLGLLKT
jgi:hypothetical protein